MHTLLKGKVTLQHYRAHRVACKAISQHVCETAYKALLHGTADMHCR